MAEQDSSVLIDRADPFLSSGQGPGAHDIGWDPELVQSLYNLLYWANMDTEQLEAELQDLEAEFENTVYSELIYLLSHLRFECDEAKDHWQRIMTHRRTLEKRLDSKVDLRVALISYFVQVDRQFDSPKIIEMRLFEEARANAYQDELTGLRNYRFLKECLTQEVLRTRQYNSPVSVILFDVDELKSYNDRYGHEAGNEALGAVARILRGVLREVDVAGRYAGEEFALILPATTKNGAFQVAERARQTVEDHFVPHDGFDGVHLTVSAGVATSPGDARDADELLRCADRAMYAAKNGGKNRVELYGKSSRSFRRVNTVLQGRFCTIPADYQPLTTLRLSEGGMLFRSASEVIAGSMLDISLDLPEGDDKIALSARVIATEPLRDGGFNTAVRFVELDAEDRYLLQSYLADVVSDRTPGATITG